jgi:aspartate/methionine/tyrosine aminotransferase
VRGNGFVRLCYAGAREDMREAVERIGHWLKG